MIRTILFVNPWQGVIGPNVGMGQLAREALSRGHAVHIVLRECDEAAEALLHSGAQLHVMQGLELTPRSVRLLSLGKHLLRTWAASRRVAALARRIAADVICINSENMLLMPRAGRLAERRVMVVVRGIRFMELGLAGRAYFGLQKRWVDRYLAVSNSVRDGLLGMGVADGRISVVCNGVDTQVFAPGPPDAAKAGQLGIPPGHSVVAAVSHLVARKGMHHLIEALGHVMRGRPQTTCLIVGGVLDEESRPYADALKKRAAELGIADRVRFLGSRNDVADIFRLGDVVVHPSETESFGRTIAEAMACGKPVVGFRVGAVG